MTVSFEKPRQTQKQVLRKAFEKLFWESPEAYVQLCRFCEARKNEISPEIKGELIEKGFLSKSGNLLRITNEIVYEATVGQEPFWLK